MTNRSQSLIRPAAVAAVPGRAQVVSHVDGAPIVDGNPVSGDNLAREAARPTRTAAARRAIRGTLWERVAA